MSTKTIFIIIISALVTIILMKNTDEVTFWIFGDRDVPKLAVLGIMFALGFIVGILVARRTKKDVVTYPARSLEVEDDEEIISRNQLSDEDKDYIN